MNNCQHEFDVWNHGDVECRLCHAVYETSWKVDKNRADAEERYKDLGYNNPKGDV